MTMECRGGILADEMGMGKSLTLLALILHTLDEARSFKNGPKNPTTKHETKRRSGATLLIAPKSSKSSRLLQVVLPLTAPF
jgi:SNF2 family DNA or RNA helicase